MDLQLTLTGSTDLGSQIYRQLRDAVVDGRLRDGERLPATRELAHRLAVSRNTVAGAYDRLTAEGFLAARVGAGTFVSAGAVRPRSRRSAPAGAIAPRPVWRELETSTTSEEATPAYDFRIGIPDGRLFPVQTWRRLLNRQLRTSMLTDARYRAPGGPSGPARRDRPAPRGVPVGPRGGRRRPGHPRRAAGGRPGRPRPGRARRLRGGGGTGLPAGPEPDAVARRSRGRRAGGRRGPGGRRAAPERPAGLHHAVAPVPDGRGHVAGPAARAGRVGGPAPGRGDRGRLRHRVPLHARGRWSRCRPSTGTAG